MKEIPIGAREIALVDDEDYEWLSQWKWHLVSCYAYRIIIKDRKRTLIPMHKVILERTLGRKLEDGELPDHKDRSSLHNWRDNLRVANRSQNSSNRKRKNKYGFKGVNFRPELSKCWCACIRPNGKTITLGYSYTKEEAARMYDKAAIGYYGEFACTNFPREDHR